MSPTAYPESDLLPLSALQHFVVCPRQCEVTPADWVKLRTRLLEQMNQARDSLRFYFLGADGKRRIEHAGNRKPVDLDGPLMV